RYVKANEIDADGNGMPILDRRLFLLDTRLPEEVIKRRYPALFAYLEEGRSRGVHERYLCRHRPLWYAQENRPPAPIVCTYLGRGDAKSGWHFRFILNSSQATVGNVYLPFYPTPTSMQAISRDPPLIRRTWDVLNRITPDQ